MTEKYKGGEILEYLDIKGFETKRSDTSRTVKLMLLKLVKSIVYDCTEDEMRIYVDEFLTVYRTLDFDDIGIPKGVRKDLDEYKIKSAMIRGVEYANKYLGAHMDNGSKPKWCYVKMKKDINNCQFPITNVVAWDDPYILMKFKKYYEPDYQMNIIKGIKNKIVKIFEVMKWNYSILRFDNNHRLHDFANI